MKNCKDCHYSFSVPYYLKCCRFPPVLSCRIIQRLDCQDYSYPVVGHAEKICGEFKERVEEATNDL